MTPFETSVQDPLYRKNLERLRRHDPGLARRVTGRSIPDALELGISKTGHPVARVRGIYLHSLYDPHREARQLIDSLPAKTDQQTAFLGLGLGYHVKAWLDSHPGPLWVVEPSLDVFQAFLQCVDLEPFLPRVRFLVDQPVPRVLSRFGGDGWNWLVHPPTQRLQEAYFNQLQESLGLQEDLRSHPLRILLIPPVYGGSLPTARHCRDALERLGHEVAWVPCEQFNDGFTAIQSVTSNKKHSKVLAERFLGMMDEMILAKAAEFGPDLVLALAQAPLGKDAIQRLRPLEVPLAFWFVEDFRTLSYWKDMASHYDHFFTIQQGECLEALKKAGCRDPYYLPQAAHPPAHRPLTLTAGEQQKFGAEVSFMGAAYFNRLQSFQQLLDFKLRIWGTGWDPASVFGPFLQKNGERVSTEECVKIFNGGTINLNLHSSTYHEGVNPAGDFVNPRTFEIAACGAFQLVDRREELEDLFRVPEEMVVFDSIARLREQIDYYLDRPEERKKVSDAGRRRVLSEHTIQQRMQELLLVVFQNRRNWLRDRWDRRKTALDYLLEDAGEDTELGRYLQRFRNTPELSLKHIREEIQKGQGKLSKNELLLLMVDQVMK